MSLLPLISTFASISLLAVGGANAVIPEIHRHVVEGHHWLSETEFGNLFALAQAAPGPNMLFVTLVGWRVAGWLGAIAATVAMCLPAALLTFGVAVVWDRIRNTEWRERVQIALAPLTIGLVAASGYLLTRGVEPHGRAAVLAAVVASLAYFTKINPLLLLGLGALTGAIGL